ncbi:MAG: hypothetical protein U9Q83_12520 [Bacteroidota bacterium]|nr:hypothetical protein [Bacteroidota bacterium]
MKNSILIIILFTIFINPVFSQQPQIPNSGFEEWDDANQATGWTCSFEHSGITINTAQRENSTVYWGNFAAKLETKDLFGEIIPEMIQLGELDIDNMKIYGGIPFTAKPTAFEIFLKYNQLGNDSLVVICYLTRYDESTNTTIQLGGSYYYHAENIDTYTKFRFPIYYTEEGTPDTINIGFASSYKDATAGSILWVDSLNLLYENFLLAPIADYPTEVKDTSFIAKWAGAHYTEEYYLDVASDPDFNNYLPGFENKTVDTTECYVRIPDNSIEKIYYRVKSNYDTLTSEYSETMEFPVPYTPEILPSDDITTKYFVAKWEKIKTADHYIINVARDSNFYDFVDGYYYLETDSNEITVVGLERDTKYYYLIKAYYPRYHSEYSELSSITTPVSEYGDEIQFFTLPDKLIIFAEESVYGSNFNIFDANGREYFSGTLEKRYTEVPLKSIKILIFNAQTPNGVFKQKIGISDMGSY